MVNADYEPTADEDQILSVIEEETRVNPYLLRERTGLDKGSVNTALTRLTSAGWVRKVTRGLYEYVDDPRDDTAAGAPIHEPAERVEETEPEPESEPAAPTNGTGDVELPNEIDGEVWDIVDDISSSWDDAEQRLRNRRQAAATVLQYATDTGEVVGKSHDIVARVRDEYPVTGQNEETFWRKNIRDVLGAVGEYSRGKHGYTVDSLDRQDR